MSLLILALWQAVTATPPERIDLTQRRPCESAATSPQEIVVCGRSGSGRYRLKDAVRPVPADLPKAEVSLADGVTAAAETEGAEVGGQQSNRIMARVRVRF